MRRAWSDLWPTCAGLAGCHALSSQARFLIRVEFILVIIPVHRLPAFRSQGIDCHVPFVLGGFALFKSSLEPINRSLSFFMKMDFRIWTSNLP